MKKIIFLLVIQSVLLACASPVMDDDSSLNSFLIASPVAVMASQPAIKWKYAVKIEKNPHMVSNIKFSCDDIPGSVFSAKVSDIKFTDIGVVFVDGPIFPISKELTPWVYDNGDTQVTCKALVKRVDEPEFLVSLKVNYSASMKSGLVEDLERAHAPKNAIKN